MAFLGFGKKSEGGLMDAIRCDEKDFLIWKWRPAGQAVNSTSKENAIRTGSSIDVRPGQAAVFLYQQKEGEYDVIKGPYGGKIETDNLPILSSIIGTAYAGGTPFQASVYFFNLARGQKVSFTIPYFSVPAAPPYENYMVPVAIKGSLVFNVPNDKQYIKNLFEAWGGNDTTMAELEEKLKDLLIQGIKGIVANAPQQTGVFVLQLNKLQNSLGKYILSEIGDRVFFNAGVVATDILITEIRFDEEDEGYRQLKQASTDFAHSINMQNQETLLLAKAQERERMKVDQQARNKSVIYTTEMNLKHQEDMLARMRDEGQFAQHQQTLAAAEQAHMMNQAGMHRADLASETAFLGAHQVNVQADVMKTGLNNMGDMGAMNLGGGNGHMNPAGMMTSMMMGTAVASQMGGMMNNMGSAINQSMQPQVQPQMGQTPPPMPGGMQAPPPMPTQQAVQYFINVNGQQYGPCDTNAMMQMAQSGQIDPQTMVWTNGMPAWAPICQVPALASLFQQAPPQGGMCPPPFPNM